VGNFSTSNSTSSRRVDIREGNAGERVLAAYALMELWEEHPESLAHVEVICRK